MPLLKSARVVPLLKKSLNVDHSQDLFANEPTSFNENISPNLAFSNKINTNDNNINNEEKLIGSNLCSLENVSDKNIIENQFDPNDSFAYVGNKLEILSGSIRKKTFHSKTSQLKKSKRDIKDITNSSISVSDTSLDVSDKSLNTSDLLFKQLSPASKRAILKEKWKSRPSQYEKDILSSPINYLNVSHDSVKSINTSLNTSELTFSPLSTRSRRAVLEARWKANAKIIQSNDIDYLNESHDSVRSNDTSSNTSELTFSQLSPKSRRAVLEARWKSNAKKIQSNEKRTNSASINTDNSKEKDIFSSFTDSLNVSTSKLQANKVTLNTNRLTSIKPSKNIVLKEKSIIESSSQPITYKEKLLIDPFQTLYNKKRINICENQTHSANVKIFKQKSTDYLNLSNTSIKSNTSLNTKETNLRAKLKTSANKPASHSTISEEELLINSLHSLPSTSRKENQTQSPHIKVSNIFKEKDLFTGNSSINNVQFNDNLLNTSGITFSQLSLVTDGARLETNIQLSGNKSIEPFINSQESLFNYLPNTLQNKNLKTKQTHRKDPFDYNETNSKEVNGKVVRRSARVKAQKEKLDFEWQNSSEISISSLTEYLNVCNKNSDLLSPKSKRALLIEKWKASENKANSQPPKNGTHLERLQWLQKQRMTCGTYVYCDRCNKCRYLPDVHDPLELPKLWYCFNHPDDNYNSCSIPEKELTAQEHFESLHNIFNTGSIVWVKMGKRYKLWIPAMVDDDPQSEAFYKVKPENDIPTHYHVIFFDKNIKSQWCPVKNLKKYDQRNPNKEIIPSQQDKLDYSIKTANKAMKMSHEARIKKYSFLTILTRECKKSKNVKTRAASKYKKKLVK